MSACSRIGLAGNRSGVEQWLAPQQHQRAQPIGYLAFASHAQCLIDWHEANFHEFSRLGVRLAQLDAGGEIGKSTLVGDAVGGVELV